MLVCGLNRTNPIPASIGQIDCEPTAGLKPYYNPTTVLQPLEQFALYNSSAANGAVLLVTLSVVSRPSPRYPSFQVPRGMYAKLQSEWRGTLPNLFRH